MELAGGTTVNQDGSVLEREKVPPLLLSTLTFWLCWVPFNGKEKVTGLGVKLNPNELPPLTVRVTLTAPC